MPYERTLTFVNNNPEKLSGLMLIFDHASDGLYVNKFPVVWKSVKFEAPEIQHQFTATVSSQLAWCKAAVNNLAGRIMDTSGCTPVLNDRGTKLQQGEYPFIATDTDYVSLVNGTAEAQNVVLGFLPQAAGAPVVPMYHWNLGASATIHTKFRPLLRAYVTRSYATGHIFHGAVGVGQATNTYFLREWNLSTLADNTTWALTYEVDRDPQFMLDAVAAVPAE